MVMEVPEEMANRRPVFVGRMLPYVVVADQRRGVFLHGGQHPERNHVSIGYEWNVIGKHKFP